MVTILRNISKKQFRQIKQELRAIAKKHGSIVNIRKRPIIWNRYGHQGPNFGAIEGSFCTLYRNISITYYGNCSRKDILFILAHEVRHAVHAYSGMYSDYYNTSNICAIMQAIKKGGNKSLPIKFINEENAYLAENDCQVWAYKYLKQHNIVYFLEEYPKTDTMAASLNRSIMKQSHILTGVS